MDKPLILIIDDEKDFADNLSALLESGGKYETMVAYSGKSGLEILEKGKGVLGLSNRFKLILLDIKMPEMTGLEFLDKLREDYSPDKVGVIILTAWEDEEKIEAARAGGVIAYLKKPFKEEELLSAVDGFLGKGRGNS